MMYRDHKEYNRRVEPDHELLRSWLRGDSGVESLRKWLDIMYN
ncbi:MAG: hypothetical protein Q7J68_00380 [Thermoplasmata archaeon]|nr:hypothetical protein [Thermoplasmata archaeon]